MTVSSLPPLVPPGPELTREQVARYSRHLLIPEVGMLGQRRLANARVLVVGAGGLGSPALLYLAAAGVGVIGIVDDDVVELSNLQRQVIHGQSDIGTPKVESAAASMREVNPQVEVVLHPGRLTASSALEILAGYDLVLDGTDTFETRYLINDACELLGLPYVWGSILRFDGQVSLFWDSPPPGFEPVTYRDLHPVPPKAGAVPSCAQAGVMGALCACIGSVMVTEAIKLICGIGEPLLGRVLVLDGLAMTWRSVRVRANPAREPLQGLPVPTDVASLTGPELPSISARDLEQWLVQREAGQRDFDLVDVRDAAERDIVTIPGARHVRLDDLMGGQVWDSLRDRPVVFHCKSGGRSAIALELALAAGLAGPVHLDGGVLAWVRDIDPGLPTY